MHTGPIHSTGMLDVGSVGWLQQQDSNGGDSVWLNGAVVQSWQQAEAGITAQVYSVPQDVMHVAADTHSHQ